MTNNLVAPEDKTPALKGWASTKHREPTERSDEATGWVVRVQRQGLSPLALEAYLMNGWTVGAIAFDRHLDSVDVAKAIDRWL